MFKKIKLNFTVTIIYVVLCGFTALIWTVMPVCEIRGHSSSAGFFDKMYFTFNTIDDIWYIGLIALILSAVLMFLGRGILSFIVYWPYVITSLVLYYQLFVRHAHYRSDLYFYDLGLGYIHLFLLICMTGMAIAILILTILKISKMPKNNSQTIDRADAILKYKELLDVGAISEEEFNKKKEELLK